MRVRVTPLDPELEQFEGEASSPPELGWEFVVWEDDEFYWLTAEVSAIGLGFFDCVDGNRYTIELLESPRASA